MRNLAALAVFVALAACHKGPSNEAIRQAVIERLSQPGMGLNLSAMDVNLTSVQLAGSEADATVQLTLKDAKDMPGMTVQYHLRQDGNKWVVTGLSGSGMNPHGGAATAPAPAGQMPAPSDLPPAGKNK